MTLEDSGKMDLVKAELEGSGAKVEMIANVTRKIGCLKADVDFTILAEFPNGEK